MADQDPNPEQKWYKLQGSDGKWYKLQAGSPDEARTRVKSHVGGAGFERGTAQGPLVPPSIAKPSVPMSKVYLGSAGVPTDSSGTVPYDPAKLGNPISDAAKSAYQVSAPGMLASILKEKAPGAAAKLPSGMAENAAPLQKLPGQAITAFTLGGGAEGFLEGAPESGALARTNASIVDSTAKSGTAADTVAQTGRQIYEPLNVPQEVIPPGARTRTRAATGEPEPATGPGPYRDPKLAHLSDKQYVQYQAKIDAANEAHAAKLAEAAQKETEERAINTATRDVQNNLMSTYKTVKSSLDTRWNDLRSKMGTYPVSSPTDMVNGIQEAESKFLRGSPATLQQFRQIVRELGIKDFVEREDGTLEPSLEDSKPMDWETARVHYSNLGNRIARGGLDGNVYQAMKYVHDQVLGEGLEEAADQAGFGQQYSNLNRDWSEFMTDWRATDSPSKGGSAIPRVLQSADAGFARTHIVGPAGERMAQTLAKYQKFGAKPELVGNVRDMFRNSKLPRIKAVPVPRPEAPAPGKLSEPPGALMAGASIAGKVAGGIGGGAVGHPWIGWATGGEVGRAILRKIWRSKHPLPEPPPMTQP